RRGDGPGAAELLPARGELRRGARAGDRPPDRPHPRRAAIWIIREDRAGASLKHEGYEGERRKRRNTKEPKEHEGTEGTEGSGATNQRGGSPDKQDQRDEHGDRVVVAVGRRREVVADHDEGGRHGDEGVVLRAELGAG